MKKQRNNRKNMDSSSARSLGHPVSDKTQSLDVSCPTVSELGMRILYRLIGRPPQVITEIAQTLGVSRPTIQKELDELVAMRFVEQQLEKCVGRGRPRYLYSAMPKAQQDLLDNTQEVIWPALWKTILRRLGTNCMERIQQDVADCLVESYEKPLLSKKPETRLREMTDFLVQQGRLAEMREYADSVEVFMLGCPFSTITEETGSICRIHLISMQKLIGNAMSAAQIAHRGQLNQHCCVFLFRKNEKWSEYPDQGGGI